MNDKRVQNMKAVERVSLEDYCDIFDEPLSVVLNKNGNYVFMSINTDIDDEDEYYDDDYDDDEDEDLDEFEDDDYDDFEPYDFCEDCLREECSKHDDCDECPIRHCCERMFQFDE